MFSFCNKLYETSCISVCAHCLLSLTGHHKESVFIFTPPIRLLDTSIRSSTLSLLFSRLNSHSFLILSSFFHLWMHKCLFPGMLLIKHTSFPQISKLHYSEIVLLIYFSSILLLWVHHIQQVSTSSLPPASFLVGQRRQ